MKVLLVSSGSGSHGGGEIYLRYLAGGLARHGCDVHALIGADPAMDELAGEISRVATVHRLALENTYRRTARSLGAVADIEQRRRVRAFIEGLRPDITHVNQQVAEDGLDLLLAAGDVRGSFVTTIHITASAAALGARMGAVRDFVAERVLSALAPPIVVVSAAASATLRARGRLAGADVRVINPAVPDADRDACAAARDLARRHWGIGTDEVAIGCVGRIENQKNPLFAVELLAGVAAAGRRVRLVWIGDGSLRGAVVARAAELGIADRLTIDGWRPDASLRMAGLDILVMPSRFEGMPLALLEAMHAGLAVCVSDVDGMPEAIRDGETGLVRPAGRQEAWRAAIGQLADDPGVRARLGRRAQDAARRRFSLDAMAHGTMALYRSAIERAARSHEGASLG